MTTEKEMKLIKNIVNRDVGEEEKILLNEMKKGIENDEYFENKGVVLPKKMKIVYLYFINNLLNGDEKIMNIQIDENDVNFLKEMHKKAQKSKMFSSIFDKIDINVFNTLLDMKL